ncbi:FG-GAP repeat domain-containing protein [Calycomorphotria hydatis]|uniref:FG-GAP repeat protein n=1 Tax=Calycomorphotria hydatis TaxID=2528027 RepID=A0A517T539_9PLAN|nr:VCBS repeat-containing protein [Calycomorphotria hydatis]QDT63496.1 FG-GAP repeat protein [Calycomorphotria hydatis]
MIQSLKLVLGTAVCVIAVVLLAIPASADDDLANYYGFDPIEVIKLDHRSANLKPADVDNDGLTDLVLIDNGHSRIDILRQRPEPEKSEPVRKRLVNAIPATEKYEHVKVPVDREIIGLTTGDFDNDGLTDLAYVAVPDRLTIRYVSDAKTSQLADRWSKTQSLRLPDIPDAGLILATGDFNSDKLSDLAVVGKEHTYLVLQGPDGKMLPPQSILNTSENLSLFQAGDFNGDGRDDFCYTNSGGGERSLALRLQTSDNKIGPEYRFNLKEPRSVTVANIDGKPGDEILTIDSATGRWSAWQVDTAHEGEKSLTAERTELIRYGFGNQSARVDRDIAFGDVDGDGRTDVIIADPADARMIVFRQQPTGGLDLGTSFPGLLGVEQVRAGDLDGDGQVEIIVFSEKEHVVALSRYEDGRLTFPKPISLSSEGSDGEPEPLAIDLCDMTGDGHLELVVNVVRKEGRKSKYQIQWLSLLPDGWHPLTDAPITLDLSGEPERMMVRDLNGDDIGDFLFFPGRGRPAQVFLRKSDGTGLNEVSMEGGLGLGATDPGAVTFGISRGLPFLLAAQGKFARSLTLSDDAQWQVIDQYNAGESAANIAAAIALNLDADDDPEIALIDTGVQKIRFLKKEGSLYRKFREIETGPIAFISAHIEDLNSDGRDDLVLFNRGRLAVRYSGNSQPILKQLANYETQLERTFFLDSVAGDLNNDGFTDVVLLDGRSHLVEILDYDPNLGARSAIHWQLFEEKSFRNEEGFDVEPRESAIADVTGDGRNDLILLAHDRVLIYPQDVADQ